MPAMTEKEERGKGARLRTMLRIALRTIRPHAGLLVYLMSFR
jgi:hypothetical protein